MNETRFEMICGYSQTDLKKWLDAEITPKYDRQPIKSKGFLYMPGTMPVMLLAHLDTVHTSLCSTICKSSNGIWMSPFGIGGDDRCGVEIILSILDALKLEGKPLPHLLFTEDEEIGGVGARLFVANLPKKKLRDVKFLVEFDRVGKDDAVFYECGNKKFIKFVEEHGFKEAIGTFSDISTVAPALDVAAVNLSSGYYNPHTLHEFVAVSIMESIIMRAMLLIKDGCEGEAYKFEAAPRTSLYGVGYDDDWWEYGDAIVKRKGYYKTKPETTTPIKKENKKQHTITEDKLNDLDTLASYEAAYGFITKVETDTSSLVPATGYAIETEFGEWYMGTEDKFYVRDKAREDEYEDYAYRDVFVEIKGEFYQLESAIAFPRSML